MPRCLACLASCLAASHHASQSRTQSHRWLWVRDCMPRCLASCLAASHHASLPRIMPRCFASCLAASHRASHASLPRTVVKLNGEQRICLHYGLDMVFKAEGRAQFLSVLARTNLNAKRSEYRSSIESFL